jgi:hypothetical protein
MSNNFQLAINEKTNDQLSDIFINADDYQPEFTQLVALEITRRGIPIEKLRVEKENNSEKMNSSVIKGTAGSKTYIKLAYVMAFFGGYYGIVAGYVHAFSKKMMNGTQYYHYDVTTRNEGRKIFIFGLINLVLWLIIKHLKVV